MKSKLHNPKRHTGSKNKHQKEEEVLQPEQGAMVELRAKTEAKDLITVITKNMQVTVVSMAALKAVVASTDMVIQGVAMGTGDTQVTAMNRWQDILRRRQAPKQ